MKALATTALVALAMLGGCVSRLHGDVDVEQGALVSHESLGLMGNNSVAYQLVMLVGPPGAVECGLRGPHRLGAPWRGSVDEGRSVTITTPAQNPSGAPETLLYQCRVVTDEHPEGQIVTRVVRDIEIPFDPTLREARAAARREMVRQWCEESEIEVIAAGLTCDLDNLAYVPIMSIQPLIVHVGNIDNEGPARWTRLRERITDGCRTEQRFMCRYLTDGTWEVMQAADLERTHDVPPPPAAME